MSKGLDLILKEFKKLQNPEKSKILSGFFKTGKGQYGEGDKFLGITVPLQRNISKKFKDLSFEDLQILLDSKIHEHRLTSLFILIFKYQKGDEKTKDKIFDFYIKNTKNVNNWDLVDLSAPKIMGDYLLDKKAKRKILYKFANSKNLWEKRISILSCYSFLKKGDFDDLFNISEILLNDKHDLIHKAIGWMLREAGKINLEKEEEFLKKHFKNMPRTMLRYAIERFNENKRKWYLNK